ncbi:MAG: sarcosine oxidase subunit gamma [Steroidobacteraceae bacterium]
MADIAVRRRFAGIDAPWLETPPDLARFILRGEAAVRTAAGAAFGLDLPTQACQGNVAGTRAALWLGPDEWLLLAPESELAAISSALAVSVGALPHSLVEVSQRQVALVVRGTEAEWLLDSQCPLPLNLRDFPVGMCTRTLYGKAEIVLWRTGQDAFHVEVWRSFAAYVVEMLREVAREAVG